MNGKKTLSMLPTLLLVVTLGVFAGGSKEKGSAQTEAADTEPVQVMGVWTGSAQENFQQVVQSFTDQTGIPAEYEPAGGDIGTVLGTRIEGGNPPDIALLPQPGLLNEFAQRGALAPIEGVVGDRVDENYAQVWRELGTVDGELYGVWYKAANKSLVWYNPTIFENAGVEPPETWEQWMQVAQTISDYGVTPFSIGGASAWTLTDWFENVYIRVAGPDLYDQLIDHEIPWTHESVVTSLSYLAEVFGNQQNLAGGIEGSLEANHPQGIIRPFVENPEAAMAYGADFSAGAIINETNAELGEDALFFDFPSIENSPPSVIGGGDVAVLLNDREASRQMLRYLASADAAEIWAELGGFTSPNQNVDPSVYPSDIVRDSARALQQAEVFRFDLSDLQPSAFGSTAGRGMYGVMQEFLRNPNPEAAAQQLEADAAETFQD